MMGPAVVWIALAAGSGELIWWPRLVAKYGESFLFLLIPATLLQLPLTYAIGRYTMATGESIWQGFIRLNKWFALLLWAMMTVQFFWLGGWVTAGSSGLAHLVDFPHGWDQRAKTLFWSWLTIGILFPTLLFSPRAYRFVEGVMWFISIVTFLGLLLACLHPVVLRTLPSFLKGLLLPYFPPFAPLPRPWDPQDANALLTSLIFARFGWLLHAVLLLLGARERGQAWRVTSGTSPAPSRANPKLFRCRVSCLMTTPKRPNDGGNGGATCSLTVPSPSSATSSRLL
jgi:hypothetical protein